MQLDGRNICLYEMIFFCHCFLELLALIHSYFLLWKMMMQVSLSKTLYHLTFNGILVHSSLHRECVLSGWYTQRHIRRSIIIISACALEGAGSCCCWEVGCHNIFNSSSISRAAMGTSNSSWNSLLIKSDKSDHYLFLRVQGTTYPYHYAIMWMRITFYYLKKIAVKLYWSNRYWRLF